MLVLQTNIVGVQLSFVTINAGHFSAYALHRLFINTKYILWKNNFSCNNNSAKSS